MVNKDEKILADFMGAITYKKKRIVCYKLLTGEYRCHAGKMKLGGYEFDSWGKVKTKVLTNVKNQINSQIKKEEAWKKKKQQLKKLFRKK